MHRVKFIYLPVLLWLSFTAVLQAAEVKAQSLKNGGFENGFASWTRVAGKGTIKIVKTGGMRYGTGLEISVPSEQAAPFVAQKVKAVAEAEYRLVSRVRGINSANQKSSTAMKVEFYDQSGKPLSARYAKMKLAEDGGDSWQSFELVLKSPPTTDSANILLRVFGKGKVVFDDVRFEQLNDGKALNLSIQQSFIEAGRDSVINLAFTFTEPVEDGFFEGAKFSARNTFNNTDVSLERSRLNADSPTCLTCKAKLNAPEPGKYEVRVDLKNGKSLNAFLYCNVPSDSIHPARQNDRGSVLFDGKPFFPIGLYHVPPKKEVYLKLAESGFNCVQGHATHNLDIMELELDLAAECGLKVDVPLYYGGKVRENLAYSKRKLERFKDHKAVFCWKLSDEPDAHGFHLRDEVFETSYALRNIDRDSVLEITLNRAGGGNFFTPLCSIVQVDPYPIPHHRLKMVYDVVSECRKVIKESKGLVATLQCGWTKDLSTQPTYEQGRTMMYMALIGGANGIFWYSYSDPKWDLSTSPLWEDFRKLNEETAFVGNVAVNGKVVDAVDIISKGTDIVSRCWSYEEKTYVALVNCGSTLSEAKISLPNIASRISEYSGEILAQKSREVTIKLSSERAAIYIIE